MTEEAGRQMQGAAALSVKCSPYIRDRNELHSL